MRKLHIGRMLKRCGDVQVVSLLSSEIPDPKRREATEEEFGPLTLMQIGPQRKCTAYRQLLTAFDFRGLTSHPARVSSDDVKLFLQLQEEFDLVWIHTLHTANFFGLWQFQNALLDADDLVHVKIGLWARAETNWLRKLNSKRISWQVKQHERQIPDRFVAAAVCSETDRDFFAHDDHVHVVPNGFVAGKKPEHCPRNQQRLGCIGKITYWPNRDGMKWFGHEIWPLILARFPHARVRVVGHCEGCEDAVNFPNFDVLGFVEDASAEMETWSVNLVPLRVGGGTRLKILDGFSKLCPSVSTSIGAFGLQVTDQQNILLADTPEDFAEACIRLLEKPDLGRQLAEGGWQLLSTKYTWDRVQPAVEKAVDECLKRCRVTS